MLGSRSDRAFSLIELVIVVVIMGIVAAVAVARFGDMATRTRIATTREAVRAIQATVDEEQAATGNWPTVLTSVMFAGSRWPRNALLPVQSVPIDVYKGLLQHPGNMAATSLTDGAFWYNSTLGIVRGRVSPQGSDSETLALYNLVNGTREVALSADGGGAVGSIGAPTEVSSVGADGQE